MRSNTVSGLSRVTHAFHLLPNRRGEDVQSLGHQICGEKRKPDAKSMQMWLSEEPLSNL